MAEILIFFVLHWFLSGFSQTFFLHRYSAHRMFTLNPFWEKFWFLFTFITQGSSFLNPRGYGILHKMHHRYSDTEDDPHSPHFSSNALTMMGKTAIIYDRLCKGRMIPERAVDGKFPEWPFLEKLSVSWFVRIAFGTLYSLFYIAFMPEGHEYLYALLPVHFLMGPVHGALVNWCGHKYGYRNHEINDKSKNSLVIDFLILGELYQNNHHADQNAPNFATKWYELDFTWSMIWLMNKLKMLKLKTSQFEEEIEEENIQTEPTINSAKKTLLTTG